MAGQDVEVARLDAFAATDSIAVEAGGRRIAIYLVDGAVFATDDVCTHGEARLSHGTLIGHEIECPRHQGRFDVRSGAATCAPARQAVATYAVRIDGERVLLTVP